MNRNTSRIGVFEVQYSRAAISGRDAAVRSARPRKARMTAMKADASVGRSRAVT